MTVPPIEPLPLAPGDGAEAETRLSVKEGGGVHALRHRSSRGNSSARRKKLALSVALVVVVLASLPLGARVALPVIQGQRPRPTAAPPLPGPTYLGPKSLDPERRMARLVDRVLSRMTLQQELGQLIIVAFNGTTLTPD